MTRSASSAPIGSNVCVFSVVGMSKLTMGFRRLRIAPSGGTVVHVVGRRPNVEVSISPAGGGIAVVQHPGSLGRDGPVSRNPGCAVSRRRSSVERDQPITLVCRPRPENAVTYRNGAGGQSFEDRRLARFSKRVQGGQIGSLSTFVEVCHDSNYTTWGKRKTQAIAGAALALAQGN